MKTKIVATLGPASVDPRTMKAMVRAGVRIFRLNFSHADAAYFRPIVRTIRGLERELDLTLTAMADLCGPKIRISEVKGSPLNVDQGGRAYLGLPGSARLVPDQAAPFLGLDLAEALRGLDAGAAVDVSDGMLQFTVRKVLKADELFELRADNPGILTSHKGIAFPGRTVPLPALTDKDRRDIRQALAIGVDAAAISFVQTPEDVRDLKDEIASIGRWVPVVVKLERKPAVDNLEAILDLADGVMVARGDLGLECPMPDLPVLQKEIIAACRRREKPVIVATQMLLSMVNNPMPTRAEVTDVANAIMDGADCVMLSEETAIGRNPVKVVESMRAIARSAEAFIIKQARGPVGSLDNKADPERTLAYCACLLAEQTGSEALVCHTRSGITAQRVSGRRPRQPIYALTPDPAVLHLLNMCWGVTPRLVGRRLKSHLGRCQRFVQDSALFSPGRSVVITAGQKTPGRDDLHTNEVKVYYK
ncbi:MAG: pyruvate kinase [Desulfovibrionaceae bacterium]|nr:pyruvate kinase [Desulfovibrionaceae bacterium]